MASFSNSFNKAAWIFWNSRTSQWSHPTIDWLFWDPLHSVDCGIKRPCSTFASSSIFTFHSFKVIINHNSFVCQTVPITVLFSLFSTPATCVSHLEQDADGGGHAHHADAHHSHLVPAANRLLLHDMADQLLLGGHLCKEKPEEEGECRNKGTRAGGMCCLNCK